MKHLSLLLVTLLGTGLHAQNLDQKYEAERLTRQRNSIAQITTYRFSGPKDSTLSEKDWYDRRGNLIRREQYAPTGQKMYTGVLGYNPQGLLAQETGYGPAGELIQQFVYQYDEKGHQIDYQQLDANRKVLNHQKRVYNAAGQNTQLFDQKEGKSKFYLSASFDYDSLGRDKNFTMIAEDGSQNGRHEYVYGDKLSETYQVEGKQRSLLYANQYNAQNQLIESRHYPRDAFTADASTVPPTWERRTLYRYDGAGNLVEETNLNQQGISGRTRYYFMRQSPEEKK